MTDVKGVGGAGKIVAQDFKDLDKIFGEKLFKDIPKWLNLENLKFVTMTRKKGHLPTVIFKDNDGNLLKIALETKEEREEIILKHKNNIFSKNKKIFRQPKRKTVVSVSVAKAGTNKFENIVFTDSVKHKLLRGVHKSLPCDDAKFNVFLEALEDAPVIKSGKKEPEIILY